MGLVLTCTWHKSFQLTLTRPIQFPTTLIATNTGRKELLIILSHPKITEKQNPIKAFHSIQHGFSSLTDSSSRKDVTFVLMKAIIALSVGFIML